jgi:hypothetical protein
MRRRRSKRRKEDEDRDDEERRRKKEFPLGLPCRLLFLSFSFYLLLTDGQSVLVVLLFTWRSIP